MFVLEIFDCGVYIYVIGEEIVSKIWGFVDILVFNVVGCGLGGRGVCELGLFLSGCVLFLLLYLYFFWSWVDNVMLCVFW